MCGRYVPPEEAAMERHWKIDRRNNNPFARPRFNAAPTTDVPILIRTDAGEIGLLYVRWSLIPAWWRTKTPPTETFNARSEEAAGKPMWRDALRNSRCLMPALGWYEWNEGEQVRSVSGALTNQPYYHYSPNSEVLAIAGLWSVWAPPKELPVPTCALLSRAAAPSIAHIHHRMPVIVQPDAYNAWLDPGTPLDDVLAIIADSRQDVEGYRVSTRVNNVRNDFPELIARLQEQAAAPQPKINENYDLF